MATGNARRLMELGMAQPVASEIAAQITAGTPSAARLIELGIGGGRLARLIEQAITAHALNPAQYAEAGLPGPLIIELAAQIV